MVKWAMVIDVRMCIGCRACMQACAVENRVPIDYTSPKAGEQLLLWAKGELEYYNMRVVETLINGKLVSIPLPCMHCDDAPCVRVCPTAATYKRPDGIVAVDPTRCIGCKSCIAACPYGTRYIRKVSTVDSPAGTAGKCQFCLHRLEKGMKPACVSTCRTGALTFGDMEDPNSEVRKKLASVDPAKVKVLKKELGTRPNVYYIGI